MSREDDNKATVGRWFTHFWGKEYNAAKYAEIEVRSLTGVGAEKAVKH